MLPPQSEPMVTMRGITKSFPGVLANDHVDLDVHGGEVHALLGENGAGKSTLMKVLYGFYRADSGEIRLRGHPADIRSPRDARELRIGMVFQTFTLIPAMTVAENIALFLPHLPALTNRAEITTRIEEVSRRYGLDVEPSAEVRQLSIGEQQKVEVLKLLLADAQVLILDEPTRVLAPHEIEALFQVFTSLRRDGYAVIFITHKLHEVLACADRITVMRRGSVAATLARGEATEGDLVSLMFGTVPAEPRFHRPAPTALTAAPLLELRQVSTRGEGASPSLHRIDLAILPGEIVGVAGVSGNGQRELGDVVLGLVRCSRGTRRLFGHDATRWSVASIRARGLAYVPEDPLAMAVVPTLTVRENMALGDLKYARHGGFSMDWASVRTDIARTAERIALKLPPLEAVAGTLSGGNIQRVVIIREMARRPRLIIAFYPTRGLDVLSATATRELLLAARGEGTGVLLISEDLGELFSLSDRLMVLYRGRIAGTFKPEQTTMSAVGFLMTGSPDAHAASG